MDNWALLLTIYSIVLTIVLFIITYLLFRKESFFLRKPVTLVLLVGDIDSSRKHLRESDATFQSDDALEDAHQCVVHHPNLNRETLELLLVSHPNVTHLTLSTSGLNVLTATASLLQIGDLLYGWKSSLVSLKLILPLTDPCPPGTEPSLQMSPSGAEDLLGVINQKLTYLEHLTLVSNSRLLPHDDVRLTILRRLRSFTLDSQDPLHLLNRSFSTYATGNEELEFIQMANQIKSRCTFSTPTCALWSKFSHLNVGIYGIPSLAPVADWPFTSVFPRLLGLKYLSLDTESLDTSQYRHLMATLAVLTQLTTLHLTIAKLETSLQEEGTRTPQVLPEPELTNIRQLSLCITSFGHAINQVAFYSVDAIFPRLATLAVHFEALSCDEASCSYGPDYTEDDSEEVRPVAKHVMSHCALQLYQQVAHVAVAEKEVTFKWMEKGDIWTAAQLEISE